jgi:hypothetical protein
MKGLGERNLVYMQTFAKAYPDFEFTQEAPAQIPWYHNQTILDKVKSYSERLWYINKTIEIGWSRSVLALQIESKLYERQGNEAKKISNFKETLPSPQSDLAHSLIKDPYNFEFLGIGEEADEKEIEKRLEQQVSKLLSIGLMICHTVYHFYVARLKPKRGRGAYTSYVTEPETCSFKM